MSRIPTTNYAGSVDTTFEWATAGTDRFSRDLDLYKLSQALEKHDHAPGKGVAVSRVANGSIGTVHLAPGSVDATKLGTDAVTAIAVALNAIGALELADDAVDTAAIQNLAVTNAKIANNTIDLASKCTYVPANLAGATFTGSIVAPVVVIVHATNPATLAMGRVDSADAPFIDMHSSGHAGFDVRMAASGGSGVSGGGILTVLASVFTTPGVVQGIQLSATVADGTPPMVTNSLTEVANFNASRVAGKVPNATPGAGRLPLANGSGSLDPWVTAAATMPPGAGSFVGTAALLPAGWSLCDGLGGRMNILGRVIIGEGTVFSTTFVGGVAYGASWSQTPAGSVAVAVASHSATRRNANIAFGGGTDNVEDDHTHGITSQTFTGTPAAVYNTLPAYSVAYMQKN